MGIPHDPALGPMNTLVPVELFCSRGEVLKKAKGAKKARYFISFLFQIHLNWNKQLDNGRHRWSEGRTTEGTTILTVEL